MNSRIRLSILVLVSFIGIGFASEGRLTNVGTTAAPFLEIGVGSRAIGMGGAFVGIASDVSALHWNPAGIVQIRRGEGMFERIDWIAGISLNFLAISVPAERFGTVGFFTKTLTVPRDKVRTVTYPDGTGEEFDAASMTFGISWANYLTDHFAVGFNLKYIYERIWHEKASTFAVDIGTLYQTQVKGLRIGAVITNFGPDMQLDGSDLIIYHDVDPLKLGNNDKIMGKLSTDAWPLPLNTQLGIAYDLFQAGNSRLTVAVDALHPINNSECLNAGMELSLANILFVRAGVKSLGQTATEEGITLGGGLRYNLFGQSTIKFDYAYADFGRLQDVNRFSIFLNF